jgi:hypothetical protein
MRVVILQKLDILSGQELWKAYSQGHEKSKTEGVFD